MCLQSLTSSRQKTLMRISILLNISLLLYLSLSEGWRLSQEDKSLVLPYARNIQYFDEKNGVAGGGAAVVGAAAVIGGPPTISCPPVPSPEQPSGQLTTTGDRDDFLSTAFYLSPKEHCFNKENTFRQSKRENYWVLYNYIRGDKSFRCNETITYTTHGDFTFMDNLEPLLERWQGPASVAVYAPGTDFEKTLETIFYYRNCVGHNLIRDLVTFHIFFDLRHIPAIVPTQEMLSKMDANCSYRTDWQGFTTFKKEMNLTYPVNIARNAARTSATTHFVFPSDIELYPSPNLIPNFLEMIRRDEIPKGSRSNRRVYVNSIFEIEEDAELPKDKAELIKLLKSGVVIPFHKQVCSLCHNIPHSKRWMNQTITPGMRVMAVGKRIHPYHHWEPIYIGTNEEPQYDERLSWEGRADKMIQGYKLCVMDYEFHILDNAFLIHRPGIKTKKKLHSTLDNQKVKAQTDLIQKVIAPEVKKLYGARKGCSLF